jgi:hypothetical protein
VPRGGDQSEAICTMRPRAVALITAALFPIYCSSLHGDTEATIKSERDRPTFKQRLVEEGVAHAALVFDGDDAIAWCEYGSPAELPGIYHRNKQYDAGEGNPAPWRITCFFVDRTSGGQEWRGRRWTEPSN